jgi:hypothetical protein
MKTRILRIRVRNLASLEGEHVVELEHGPLADAGIFPIVGPTGETEHAARRDLSRALRAPPAAARRDQRRA